MRNLWRPLIHIPGKSAAATHENWFKGSLLAVISCATWSVWYIMQVFTLTQDKFYENILHIMHRDHATVMMVFDSYSFFCLCVTGDGYNSDFMQ